MDIFHYDPHTKVLIGMGVADESPLEPGVWLIPAHATSAVPPVPKKNEHVVWVNDAWDLKPIPKEPESSAEDNPTEPRPQLVGVTVDQMNEIQEALVRLKTLEAQVRKQQGGKNRG